MCHSSPHMLICGGLRGGQWWGEAGGGILLWIPLLSFFGLTLWAHMSVSLWESNVTPDKFKCCTWYASKPLDADKDGLRWNVCLIFDLWCSIKCGWVADKCIWNYSLFANLSRSNLFVATEIGRRLGWRRKDSEKVFDHAWYALWRHRYLWSCIPSKEILQTIRCFQREKGSCPSIVHLIVLHSW